MISQMLTRLDNALTRNRLLTASLFGLVSLLAIVVLAALNSQTILMDDALYYYQYGLDIAHGDYVNLVTSIRTYGYPVFVALCIRLAWLLHLPDLAVITAVQFALHIMAALVASRLAQALLEARHRPWISLFVFVLVALNPYLLAMTTQLLTDSISVVALTAFMLLLHRTFNSRSMKYCLACGFVFGLCYVIRPFHLVWGIGLMAGALLLYGPLLRTLVPYRRRSAIRRALYISMAALLMIGSQFVFTWVIQIPYGGTLMTSFQTLMTNGAVSVHRIGAGYYYRYETFGSPEALVGGPTDRTIQYYSPILRDDPGHPQRFVLPVIKTISLFQQHDYLTYRLKAGLVSPSAFAVGFVLWAFYCYALPYALWDVWQAFRGRRFVPVRALMVYALSLYIVLYAVPTIPEPRYINPIYAILTVLACVYADQETRWWPFLLSVAVALVSYLLTAHILLEFALVGYPLFL